jgi:hypothetical protein
MPKRTLRKVLASELEEQLALMEWATLQGVPLVHHCNEGKRTPQEGRKLKKMGLSPGYPDLSIAEAHGGYFGLFIELKQRRDYRPSEMNTKTWLAQRKWLEQLANDHYYAIMCFGWEHAKCIIEKYLSWPKTYFTPLHQVKEASNFLI